MIWTERFCPWIRRSLSKSTLAAWRKSWRLTAITYENAHYCKPNPAYYTEILTSCHLEPAECLMVGNDVGEDMIARKLGMRVFLLTDCLINKANEDISQYPNGSFEELKRFIRSEAEKA